MTFGQRISHRRKQLGMSQLELAKLLNLRPEALSRLEHDGIPNPGKDIIKRLCRALNCDANWLIDLYGDEHPLNASLATAAS